MITLAGLFLIMAYIVTCVGFKRGSLANFMIYVLCNHMWSCANYNLYCYLYSHPCWFHNAFPSHQTKQKITSLSKNLLSPVSCITLMIKQNYYVFLHKYFKVVFILPQIWKHGDGKEITTKQINDDKTDQKSENRDVNVVYDGNFQAGSRYTCTQKSHYYWGKLNMVL